MNELGGYAFADLRVGMCAKTVTEADIVLFAAVSGDNNAIHINEEFAAGTIFKGRIAHGLLSASVISAAIANPSGADDTVRATVTVKEMIPVRSRVLLATVCTVGVLVVIEGEALVALPAPSPPNISVRSRSKKRLPLLRRSSTEAAAGQFKVSRDTRRTGTASTTISRRGQ